MTKERAFRRRLDTGATREELMKYYVLSEEQYQRVLVSLVNNSNRKAAALH